MRIDVREYPNWSPEQEKLAMSCDVLCDGKRIDKVICADEEKGYALFVKCREDGMPVIEEEGFVYEEFNGKVQIVPRKPENE